MQKKELQILLDYNYWANGRILNAAGQVSPEQWLLPFGLSHGSLRGTLVHILGAEIVWRRRCEEGVSMTKMPTEDELPTLDELRQRWEMEEKAMRTYLDRLSDASCSQTIQYTSTRGVPYQNPLWQLLVHVVNHGTQFRAEAAVALTTYGKSPGDLDLIAFLREKRPTTI